jgi:hypothetical protein
MNCSRDSHNQRQKEWSVVFRVIYVRQLSARKNPIKKIGASQDAIKQS